MYAKKDNKVYKVDAISKQEYLKRGFDIVDEDGKLVEASSSKTIAYSEHLKIVNSLNDELKEAKEGVKSPDKKIQKENETLKAENETLKAENETLKAGNESLKAENKVGEDNGQVQE